MIIHRKVTTCDFTDATFDNPVDGVAFLSRGETGRWCEVLHGGPSILEKYKDQVMTHQHAHQMITEQYPGDWGDF